MSCPRHSSTSTRDDQALVYLPAAVLQLAASHTITDLEFAMYGRIATEPVGIDELAAVFQSWTRDRIAIQYALNRLVGFGVIAPVGDQYVALQGVE